MDSWEKFELRLLPKKSTFIDRAKSHISEDDFQYLWSEKYGWSLYMERCAFF